MFSIVGVPTICVGGRMEILPRKADHFWSKLCSLEKKVTTTTLFNNVLNLPYIFGLNRLYLNGPTNF